MNEKMKQTKHRRIDKWNITWKKVSEKCKNNKKISQIKKKVANNKCTYFENGTLHAVISFSCFNYVTEANRSNSGFWNRLFFWCLYQIIHHSHGLQ